MPTILNEVLEDFNNTSIEDIPLVPLDQVHDRVNFTGGSDRLTELWLSAQQDNGSKSQFAERQAG